MASRRFPPQSLDIMAVMFGGGAALAGFASMLSYADLPALGGDALLVVTETVSVVLFTALSACALAMYGRPVGAALALVAALAKALWLPISLASHWDPGWHGILDSHGPHARAGALLLGSALQAITMVLVALRHVFGKGDTT